MPSTLSLFPLLVRTMLFRKIIYDVSRIVCRVVAVVTLRVRAFGRRNFPTEGPAILCANHQSHFDPILLGMSCDRRINYLARKSLFESRPLAKLMDFYNTIPIDREGNSLAGIKETMRRLRRGEVVLMFPEGTRTRDGEIGPLHPGFATLARRGKAALVPIGIDGLFDVLPRGRKLPRPAVVHIVIGEPLLPEQIALLDDDTLLSEFEGRLRTCHAEARRRRTRLSGILPRPR